jgi:hypothetical protein
MAEELANVPSQQLLDIQQLEQLMLSKESLSLNADGKKS